MEICGLNAAQNGSLGPPKNLFVALTSTIFLSHGKKYDSSCWCPIEVLGFAWLK